MVITISIKIVFIMIFAIMEQPYHTAYTLDHIGIIFGLIVQPQLQ